MNRPKRIFLYGVIEEVDGEFVCVKAGIYNEIGRAAMHDIYMLINEKLREEGNVGIEEAEVENE